MHCLVHKVEVEAEGSGRKRVFGDDTVEDSVDLLTRAQRQFALLTVEELFSLLNEAQLVDAVKPHWPI